MSDEELSPEQILDGIRDMTIRGAAKIGRNGSRALRMFAEREIVKDRDEYLSKLEEFKKKILATRPTAITIWSGVTRTLMGTSSAESSEDILKTIRRNSEQFIELSFRAIEIIGEIGAKRIPHGSTILTHCNSSAVIEAIVKAHDMGKIQRVYATESRPKRQGRITVRQLADKGVPVTLIVDSAVKHHMKYIDIVMVGADTIASNGAVINKIGTAQVALIAHERRVPFIVCAETCKFSLQTFHGMLVPIEERDPTEVIDLDKFPGVEVSNPVFDATSPDYIDSIITEVGIIPPFAAYEIIVRNFGMETLKTDGSSLEG